MKRATQSYPHGIGSASRKLGNSNQRTKFLLKPTVLALAIAHGLTIPVIAANIEVNNSGDSDPIGGCSLRQAVTSSRQNAAPVDSNCVAGTIDPDTITFSSSVLAGGSISLTQVDTLRPGDETTIQGPADGTIVIEGSGNTGIFLIFHSIVTINNLTISGGLAERGGGVYSLYSSLSLNNSTLDGNSATIFGAGLSAYASDVVLNSSTVSNNSTGSSFAGGGIATIATNLDINNSTISGNSAQFAGGINADNNSSVSILNSTVANNTAQYFGGGLRSPNSTINLQNSILAGNRAPSGTEFHHSGYSGTLITSSSLLGDSAYDNFNAFHPVVPDASNVTATSNGTAPTAIANIIESLASNGGPTLTHALPQNSPAVNAGLLATCAAAPINNLDQRGVSRLSGSACEAGSFEVETSSIIVTTSADTTGTASCSLRDAITASNTDTATGGCIAGSGNDEIIFDPIVFPPEGLNTIVMGSPLPTITSTISITGSGQNGLVVDANNTGRVLFIDTATVELSSLSITGGLVSTGEAANGLGGGISAREAFVTVFDSTISGNSSYFAGGGVYAASNSNVRLHNTTVSDNSADFGGGISSTAGFFSLYNSTVSGNLSVSPSLRGGGLYARTGGVINIINSTLTGNSAAGDGGGLSVSSNSVILSNSIVVGNYGDSGAEILNDGGAIFTPTNNLLGESSKTLADAFSGFTPDASDITATLDGAQPTALSSILEPLANNGGATYTHALVARSPAIDAGNSAICVSAPIDNLDQRGKKRSEGSACDIGSYEADSDNFFSVPLPSGRVIIFSL